MNENLIDTLQRFFFKGFDVDSFENYPSIKKSLKDKKFEEFQLCILRELDINRSAILNSKWLTIQVNRFETGINEFEKQNLFPKYVAHEGLGVLWSHWRKLREIATHFLIELKKMQEDLPPQQIETPSNKLKHIDCDLKTAVDFFKADIIDVDILSKKDLTEFLQSEFESSISSSKVFELNPQKRGAKTKFNNKFAEFLNKYSSETTQKDVYAEILHRRIKNYSKTKTSSIKSNLVFRRQRK